MHFNHFETIYVLLMFKFLILALSGIRSCILHLNRFILLMRQFATYLPLLLHLFMIVMFPISDQNGLMSNVLIPLRSYFVF